MKEVKETANQMTEKTKNEVQGAGRKGKETAKAAGKETKDFLRNVGESVGKMFK